MVQIADEDDRNLLEDMFFPGSATYDSDEGGALNQNGPNVKERFSKSIPEEEKKQDDASEYDSEESSDEVVSEESEEECDPNGDVAICDACNKVLPLSKYERHLSYYCQKQEAECPMCFQKFPMPKIQHHIMKC